MRTRESASCRAVEAVSPLDLAAVAVVAERLENQGFFRPCAGRRGELVSAAAEPAEEFEPGLREHLSGCLACASAREALSEALERELGGSGAGPAGPSGAALLRLTGEAIPRRAYNRIARRLRRPRLRGRRSFATSRRSRSRAWTATLCRSRALWASGALVALMAVGGMILPSGHPASRPLDASSPRPQGSQLAGVRGSAARRLPAGPHPTTWSFGPSRRMRRFARGSLTSPGGRPVGARHIPHHSRLGESHRPRAPRPSKPRPKTRHAGQRGPATRPRVNAPGQEAAPVAAAPASGPAPSPAPAPAPSPAPRPASPSPPSYYSDGWAGDFSP